MAGFGAGFATLATAGGILGGVLGTTNINDHKKQYVWGVSGGDAGGNYDNLRYSNQEGLCWIDSTSTGETFTLEGLAVAYGNKEWIAVGRTGTDNKTILRSEDGKKWSTTSGAHFDKDGEEAGVVYGKKHKRWVAVGDNTTAGGASGAILHSTDHGKTWNYTPLGPHNFTKGRDVAYGTDRYVAVGDGTEGNDILRSDNGICWKASIYDTSLVTFHGIAYGKNKTWVAAGTCILRSTNNGVCFVRTSGEEIGTGVAVAYGNETWLVGGKGGANSKENILISRDNAKTWSQTKADEVFFQTAVNSIIYDGEKWLATGVGTTSNQVLAQSNDGETWTIVPDTNDVIEGKALAYKP